MFVVGSTGDGIVIVPESSNQGVWITIGINLGNDVVEGSLHRRRVGFPVDQTREKESFVISGLGQAARVRQASLPSHTSPRSLE